MKKSEFKKLVKERFADYNFYSNDRIVDIKVWSEKICDMDCWLYQIITISENHNASKYHGWLNEDNKTITIKYVGCL